MNENPYIGSRTKDGSMTTTKLLVIGSDTPSPRYWEGYATLLSQGTAVAAEVFGEYVGIGRAFVVLEVPREVDVDYLIDRLGSGLYGARRLTIPDPEPQAEVEA